MKSNIIRLFVLALAAAGFTASTVAAKVPSKTVLKPVVIAGGAPVGMCLPHDPTHCGLD